MYKVPWRSEELSRGVALLLAGSRISLPDCLIVNASWRSFSGDNTKGRMKGSIERAAIHVYR